MIRLYFQKSPSIPRSWAASKRPVIKNAKPRISRWANIPVKMGPTDRARVLTTLTMPITLVRSEDETTWDRNACLGTTSMTAVDALKRRRPIAIPMVGARGMKDMAIAEGKWVATMAKIGPRRLYMDEDAREERALSTLVKKKRVPTVTSLAFHRSKK